MKIGILTLPLKYNYGGILQAYALQTILERMGHDVRIIRESQQKPMPQNAILRYLKRYVIKVLRGWRGDVFMEKKHNHEFPILTAKTWRFVEKNIHSCIINDYSEIPEGEFEVFVVGSDQVWRSGYTSSVLQFFLNFAKGWDVKRIAYAASFGLDTWPISLKETDECIRLASKFDAISVREESGLKLCKKYFSKDVTLVLDPTLLLQEKDYIKLIEEEFNEKVLTTYILDENSDKLRIIESLQNKVQLPGLKLFTQEHYDIQPLTSIEEWLNSFRKSEFVFTDSFHGMVFSIIFSKQFVVFGNKHRGNSRMESLLNMLGLQTRLVHSFDEYEKIKDETIDYGNVNHLLNTWREKSEDFLKKQLKGN